MSFEQMMDFIAEQGLYYLVRNFQPNNMKPGLRFAHVWDEDYSRSNGRIGFHGECWHDTEDRGTMLGIAYNNYRRAKGDTQ